MINKEEILKKLKELTIAQNSETLKSVAIDALKGGLTAGEVISGIQDGLKEVGEKFNRGELFLPQLILTADAIQPVINMLLESIPEKKTITKGKVVIGTAYGDIHDIGKNIVAAFLRANGYEVHDLGSDVPIQNFIQKAKEVNADIIAVSNLLTASIVYQKDLIQELNDRGMNDKFVIIGGSAVNPEWARRIKADGYGRTAENAVELCDLLLKKGKEINRPVIIE
jgi:methylmalonyl-CoA mutase cobalamin-binding domain/chain